MLKIFIVMICAMALGFVMRNKKLPRKTLSNAVSAVILAMMTLIGVEMGASPSVLAALGTILTDAVLLTLGALGGTVLLAWLFNTLFVKSKLDNSIGETQKGASHTFSILIVVMFAVGMLIGYCGSVGEMFKSVSMWALYLLMALVGFNLGSDTGALKALRAQNWKVILLPTATIIGTLGGVAALSPFVEMELGEQLAIGSGFGYYSLSSVLLSELRGAEIGAVALIVNVLRELSTVVFAPLIVRRFSPIALICSGGATTLDVTLPVIVSNCGSAFVAMAIFQGVVVDFSVPFLVTFFASL